MAKHASRRKHIPILVIVLCVADALAAVSAYAFRYVRGQDNVNNDEAQDVYEILMTPDETVTLGKAKTGRVLVPGQSTADAAFDEMIASSESQNRIKALNNHNYESLRDYLRGKKYTFTTYHAEGQGTGMQTTYDGKGVEGSDVALERLDNVVITVTQA